MSKPLKQAKKEKKEIKERREKKEKKKKPKADDFDETESVASMQSASSEEIVLTEEPVDAFAELIETLTEKRSSTRVNALQKLNELMTKDIMQEQLMARLETLQSYLSQIIRKNSSEEVVLACRAVSLAILTVGLESETFAKQFIPTLNVTIKNTSKSTTIRRSCINALGTAHFLTSFASPSDALEAMASFEQLFSDSSLDDLLVAESIQIWSLLASNLPPTQLVSSLFNKFVPIFKNFLSHKSLEVRAASGESLALLFHASIETGERKPVEPERPKDHDDESSTIQLKETKYDADLAELIAQLQSLATEGSKRVAKKDTAKQKSIFREVVSTIEDGTFPTEKIVIQKKKYEFEGWAQIKQLAHIRSILGTGLPLHFEQNELMAEIFDIINQDIGAKDKPTKKSEKMERQIKGKADTQTKEKQRKKKLAFLHED